MANRERNKYPADEGMAGGTVEKVDESPKKPSTSEVSKSSGKEYEKVCEISL